MKKNIPYTTPYIAIWKYYYMVENIKCNYCCNLLPQFLLLFQ